MKQVVPLFIAIAVAIVSFYLGWIVDLKTPDISSVTLFRQESKITKATNFYIQAYYGLSLEFDSKKFNDTYETRQWTSKGEAVEIKHRAPIQITIDGESREMTLEEFKQRIFDNKSYE